jgi:hypothetical protein
MGTSYSKVVGAGLYFIGKPILESGCLKMGSKDSRVVGAGSLF